MRYVKSFLLISLVLLCFSSTHVSAQTTVSEPKGLALSPPRQSVTVNAGKTSSFSVTAANFTDKTLAVSLSVQEFSVSDYTYTYQFRMPKESWITFSEPQFTLEPRKTKTVSYIISPPANAAPGGKYYTVTASAPIKDGQVTSNIQVAAPLYIAVGGEAIYASQLVDHTVNQIAFGGRIPFSLDIKNTGNIHYNIATSARLTGLFTNISAESSTHILLPGTIRHIDSSLPTPIFPGIYQATYGYTTDYSDSPVLLKAYVLYTPPWFYAFIGLGVWGLWILYKNVRKRKNSRKAIDSQPQPYK